MSKVLGLDLGTSSIGWAIKDREIKDGNQIINYGVHIFPKGVGEEKNVEFSLAAERTKHRSSRRRYFRRKLRKYLTLKKLIEFQMCPLSIDDLNKWVKHVKGEPKVYPDSELFRNWLSQNPYELRNFAADSLQKLSLFQTGRALYHICQRRGYLSNRKDQNPNSNTDKEIEVLTETKAEKTLGQYFASLNPHKHRIRTTKTGRMQLIEEFDTICKAQKLESTISNALKREIFFQRPLKSQKHLTGKCPFEPNKYRCHISHPLFEYFRMLTFINNIKYKLAEDLKGEFEPLTKEQKDSVIHLFYRKKATFDFEDISKELNPKENKKKKEELVDKYEFNYKNHVSIPGCPTSADLKGVFGEDWQNFKIENDNFNVDIFGVWNVVMSFEDSEKIIDFGVNKLGLSAENAEKLAKVKTKEGYSSLSLKAIKKIIPYLEQGLIYSHAAFLANMPEVVGADIWHSKQNEINQAVTSIISNHKSDKTKAIIVNNLIAAFRNNDNYSGKNYTITLDDKNQIRKIAEIEFGAKYMKELSLEETEGLYLELEIMFQSQITKGKQGEFVELKRIDEKIFEFLTDNYDIDQKSLEKMYHPSDIEVFPKAKPNYKNEIVLGCPRTPSVRNPMAMRALQELKELVNELIRSEKLSIDDTIIIEMARELNDANKRKAIQRYQRELQKLHVDYLEEIEKLYKAETGIDIEVKENDILKYQLWIEQKKKCLYTGKTIAISQFLGANPVYDIEHTLPISKSYDNSQENKTLTHSYYNRFIKGTKLPIELPNYETEKQIKIDGEMVTCPAIKNVVEIWNIEANSFDYKINGAKKASQSASTKEAKDDAITNRHYFQMQKDYWANKYKRFSMTEIKNGFKSSQLVDTGIITKYAKLYLETVFENVYTVKGSIVAEFRKMWGIQNEYEKKSREVHTHHAIDAVVISCLDRKQNFAGENLYDALAHYYLKEDEYNYNKIQKPKFPKPWVTFTEDCKYMSDNMLISHKYRDNVLKQTKKKLRHNGKIDFTDQIDSKNKKIPKYEQGLGIRTSLHMETYYGAISRPAIDKDFLPVLDKEGKQINEIKYRLSKDVNSLKEPDIKNIVDDKIRRLFIEKGLKTIQSEGIFLMPNLDKNPNGKPVPIKKIKVFASDVKTPLKLKQHSHLSKKEHKKFYHVKNEGNFQISIYRGFDEKGKEYRDFKIVNNLELSEFIRAGEDIENIVPQNIIKNEGKKNQLLIDKWRTLKLGQKVLLYENSPDEILLDKSLSNILPRLYKVQGISILRQNAGIIMREYGVISFTHHLEAKPIGTLNLLGGTFKFDDKISYRKLYHSQFNGLVEGTDFEINVLSEVIFNQNND